MKNAIAKRLQYNSPVVLTFFLISLVSLVLGLLTGGLSTRFAFAVYRSSLVSPMTYLRLFTHVLGHADLSHFMNNMLLFLVVGPPMEEKYGSQALLGGIAFTAVVSGFMQMVFFPSTMLLGASGIVFMLIMLNSLSGMKEGKIPLTLILVAVMYLGKEVYSMIFVQDSVANFMHILGGICGTLFGFWAGRKRLSSYNPY